MSSVKKTLGNLSQQKLALLSKKLKERADQAPRRKIDRRPDRFAPCRLSFAQQRMWFLDQLAPNNPLYNIPCAARLGSWLDLDVLERVINEIVRRHEILRTRFEVAEGEPVQVIDEWKPRKLELKDLTSRSRDEKEEEADRIAREEARAGFDLSRGPLLRVKVLKLEEDEHIVLFTMHHIVSDGWSMGILIREVNALYQAYSRGESSPLEELEIQYADFAVWQRQWLKGEALEKQLEYWRKQLAGIEALELPADHPRPAVPSYRGAKHRFVVRREVAERLRDLSQQEGVTVFMVLLGALDVLMSRYSGQEDIVLGTDIANRNQADVEGLIGFFVNQLVLRVRLGAGEDFRGLLKRVKEVCLGAYAHQDVPFEKLVEELQPERNLSRSPLFQAKLIFENATEAGVELEEEIQNGRRGELRAVSEEGMAKFDLTVAITEMGRDLVGSMEYSLDLFEEETVERLVGHYANVLKGIVEDGRRPICEMSLLSDREREQIVVEWNRTGTPYPQDLRIHQLFERQVDNRPEAIALIYEERQLTYAELNARANQLAHHLLRRGVRPETLVAICVERSVEMVVGLLAILKAGGAYLPLDPAYPVERLSYMLEDSAPVAVLTHAPAQAQIYQALTGIIQTVPVIDLEADARLWDKEPQTNPDQAEVRSRPEHMAYVIYTSGSTGRPKGVMVEQANMARLFSATASWFKFDQNDVWTLFHSFAFDFSVWEIWGALIHGARLVIAPHLTTRSPSEFYQLLYRAGVTILNQTPGAFNQLIAAQGASRQAHQLRYVIFGGEALDVARLEPWRRNRRNLHTQLINMYGITETTVHVTYRPLGLSDRERVGGSPIGRRIPDLKVYLLDSHGQPVPIGVAGEMYVGGAGVARGYLNRPELTAERFVADPFGKEPGARIYRTGDLARYLPEGEMEFLGRNDFQVKIRGFRIELGEIEARLLNHPAIGEAIVVARENNGGDKRLVAYYTELKSEAKAPLVSPEALRSYVSAALPEHMAPAAYVRLEALPLTPHGKLDRKALPSPDGDAYAAHEYEAPRGETERALAQIWAELLHLERVGRHDNFFALGGHSMLAVSLIERMRREGLTADVRALFTTPDLAALAAATGHESRMVEVPPNRIPAGCESITPEMLPLVDLSEAEVEVIVSRVPGGASNIQDIYPLAPLQEGILFHSLMATEGDPYLMYSMYRFDTRARLDGFLQALQNVINRHDILRTSMQWEGLPEPVQVVWRRVSLTVEEVATDPAVGGAAEQLLAHFNPLRRRIDIRQAPLMRVCIAQDAVDERWVALCLFHHLIDDITSINLLVGEIQAHLLGRAEQLPAPLPFRNYVVQARLGMSRQEHEAFFRKMLSDVDEPTAPFGLSNVHDDGSNLRKGQREVDAFVASRLRERARALGVSVASLCHLAWARVLAQVSEKDDVVFGTVLLGRMHGGEGADRVVGMFINTLPIRVRIGEESVEESVRRTHALLAELLRHEHAPLVLAQRCSAVVAPAPLFSALLNYRHSAAAEAPDESSQAWEGVEILGGEERGNYPFNLDVSDWGTALVLTSHTQSPIDPDRICDYMHTALEGLVEALETAPGRAMREVEALPETERRRMLEEWNATEADYPAARSRQEKRVHELFEAQVEARPEAIALVCEEKSLTYCKLNDHANRLARRLRELGVGPDVRVGICLERGFGMVGSVLGVMKAGGVYVPMDPAYPVERLNFMAEESGCEVVISGAGLKPEFERSGHRVVDPEADGQEIRRESVEGVESGVDSANLAYVIYTSGSTGKPKGVMISHGSLSNRVLWEKATQPPDESDAFLQLASFSFDVSVWELFTPLASGARLILPGPGEHQNPERIARLIQEHEVTIVGFVPSMLEVLLDEPVETRFASLKRVLSGAEALPLRTMRRFILRCDAELYNFYGPTESTIDATFWKCSLEDGRTTVPVGRPLGNLQAYVLDSRMKPVPIGVTGQLYIGGAGLARGYQERPDLTAEMFIPNPFNRKYGARLYRTGDLARYRADGNIESLGRMDQQVKIRGFRIELEEIESALKRHPAVREAVVLVEEQGVEEQGRFALPEDSGRMESSQVDWLDGEFLDGLPADYREIRKLIERIDSLSEEEVDLALLGAES